MITLLQSVQTGANVHSLGGTIATLSNEILFIEKYPERYLNNLDTDEGLYIKRGYLDRVKTILKLAKENYEHQIKRQNYLNNKVPK